MTKSKKKSRIRSILAPVLTLALVLIGLLVFMYRDYLTPERLGELFGGGSPSFDEANPFAYESAPNQAFAAAGDGLAVASASGARLFDRDGRLAASQIFSLSRPAVAASERHAAFFDIGGKTLRVASFDGDVQNLDTERAIIACTMNKNGWLCVITEYTGTRGLVSVYNSSLGLVYEVYSHSSFVLSAQVSPDNKFLALLYAGLDGGSVKIYSLSSDVEYGSMVTPDELLIDLRFLDNGMICAISESRAVFFNLEGELAGEFDFGGRYLIDYSLDGDSFAALLLGTYRSGNEGELVTVGRTGEVLGSFETMSDYLSIFASGDELLTLASDGLTLYSSKLAEKGTVGEVSGARSARLLKNGEALLLTPYAAIKHNIR